MKYFALMLMKEGEIKKTNDVVLPNAHQQNKYLSMVKVSSRTLFKASA